MKLVMALLLVAVSCRQPLNQKSKPDSCQGVKTNIQQYIGKTVTFVGGPSNEITARSPNGKQPGALYFWTCADGGGFAFDRPNAAWSDAARQSEGPPFRVTGTVVGAAPLRGVAILKNVTIDAP